MRILHLTPAFYPAHIYGGAVEAVYQLCRYLGRSGCEVRVLTTDANGPDKILDLEKDREVEVAKGIHVRYCRRWMCHSASWTFLRLLPSYIRWADVVHLTAVYSFPTIPTLLACKVLCKPVVWSPHGAFQRWDRTSRLALKAIWEGVCKVVAPKRLILHVTSEEEAIESLQRFPGVETVVIPIGIEVPEKVMLVHGERDLHLLYLGRLHPKKGIENLLDACKILNNDPEVIWSLTIAGAGDSSYTATILTKIKELMLTENVKMVGEVRGEEKRKLFTKSSLTVVPSFTENFGLVVTESLAHGVPVLTSKGTPWKRVESIGCGLWVGNDPEELAKAIKQMSRMQLQEMGQRGRKWMQQEFAWPSVAKRITKLYHDLMVYSCM